MDKEMEFLHQLVPEVREIMHLRYKIMTNVSFMQPVGRRMLANKLGIKERRLRNELEFLKEKQFIQSSSTGMFLTQRGEELVNRGRDIIRTLSGLSGLEIELTNLLDLREVFIVPGDSYEDEVVKQEIGGVAAKIFRKLLEKYRDSYQESYQDKTIVAVTGGSTLAAMAEMLPYNVKNENVTVVPARGGLGEKVEHQANTVAADIAKKLECSYRMLHVPEQLSPAAVKTLLSEPKIKNIVNLIKKSHILIHGIGRAEVMAKRRESSEKELNYLEKQGAIGEAFGFYLDKRGQVIEKINTVGLTLGDLDLIPLVVAVSGGKDKAEAILAMMATQHNDILITDEGAANRILHLLKSKS